MFQIMTRLLERSVLLVAATCASASFSHFAHNAEFCGDYPGLPPWLTRGSVWLAWVAITLVGVAGMRLVRIGWRKTGLVVLVIYGALGCDGLGHYSLAPMARHTAMMNFTIWFEVLAGLALVGVALGALRLEFQGLRPQSRAR